MPPRKPLLPVQLLAVSCDGTIADLVAGHAIFVITTGDATDSDTRVYWLKADLDHAGHVTGFELTQFLTNHRYRLPADLGSCDCLDHTFREERPGGCKHQQALRQALLAVVMRPPRPAA
jgi:hypothetical protein